MNLLNNIYYKELSNLVGSIQWDVCVTIQTGIRKTDISNAIFQRGMNFFKVCRHRITNDYWGQPIWFMRPIHYGVFHSHMLIKFGGKCKKTKRRDHCWRGVRWKSTGKLDVMFAAQKMNCGFPNATFAVEPYDSRKGHFDFYVLNNNHEFNAFDNCDTSSCCSISKYYYQFSGEKIFSKL